MEFSEYFKSLGISFKNEENKIKIPIFDEKILLKSKKYKRNSVKKKNVNLKDFLFERLNNSEKKEKNKFSEIKQISEKKIFKENKKIFKENIFLENKKQENIFDTKTNFDVKNYTDLYLDLIKEK